MTSNLTRAWEALVRSTDEIALRLDRAVAKAVGMTTSEIRALRTLSESKEALTVSEVADRLLLSAARTSRLLSELEDRKLVAQAAGTDARHNRSQLTLDGRARLREASEVYEKLTAQQLAPVAPDEITAVALSLEQVARSGRVVPTRKRS